MRQGRLLSHMAGCRRRDLTSTFCAGRVQNERVRPGHTWREPGGSTNWSISDSVRLEPGRDKSAIEVATVRPTVIFKKNRLIFHEMTGL